MDKQFWSAVLTLSGSIIGAGILGLPYVISKSGFLIGLMLLIILSAVMLVANLYFVEIILRTKENHQFTGYAELYLGQKGKVVAGIVMVFGIYAALTAYLVGEGQSIAQLIPGSPSILLTGAAFWLCMTLLLQRGLQGLKKVETYGVIGIMGIIVVLMIVFLPQVEYVNLLKFNWHNFTAPIGVILFAVMGFSAIPELKEELQGNERLLKKAVIYGSLIPIVLYGLFTTVIIGVLGDGVSEIATLSFGPLIALLGVFTMFTSYFVLSYALKETFELDFHLSKGKNFVATSLAPLGIFIAITLFDIAGFSTILGVTGVISATITGITIIWMNRAAKRLGKRKPEVSLPLNWFIILAMTALFIVAAVLQFSG